MTTRKTKGINAISDLPDAEFAACRFCGQITALPGKEYFSEADMIEDATIRCDCPDGYRYKTQKDAEMDREYALERAQTHIEDMYGTGAEKYGLDSVDEDVKHLMLTVAAMIYDKRVKDTTIVITPELKVKINMSAKNKLILTRSDAAVVKQEI